jgi:tetratricopeptide (TPR) repeat protein
VKSIARLLFIIDRFKETGDSDYLDSARWELFDLLSKKQVRGKLITVWVLNRTIDELEEYLGTMEKSRFAWLLPRLKGQLHFIREIERISEYLEHPGGDISDLKITLYPDFDADRKPVRLSATSLSANEREAISDTKGNPPWKEKLLSFYGDKEETLGTGKDLAQELIAAFENAEKGARRVKALFTDDRGRGTVEEVMVEVYEWGSGYLFTGYDDIWTNHDPEFVRSLLNARNAAFSYLSELNTLRSNPILYDIFWQIGSHGVICTGRSLGLTIAAAIIAQQTGSSIPPDVAMTGELYLDGTVGMVGEVAEKLHAAAQQGLRNVLIPIENLLSLPESFIENSKLELTGISTLSDACDILFGKQNLVERIKNSYVAYSPEPIPLIRNFVGRESELRVVREKIVTSRVITITGIAGIGKTSFGAQCVKTLNADEKTFWFPSSQLIINRENIYAQLSSFLKSKGDERLWLNRDEQDWRIKEILLADCVETHELLLCFDDFHSADRSDVTRLFFKFLMMKLHNGRMILLSREKPRFYSKRELSTGRIFELELEGLKKEEMETFFKIAKKEISPSELEDIRSSVWGHPMVLELVQRAESSLKIQMKEDIESVIDFLIEEIYEGLNRSEKTLLRILSITKIPFSEEICDYIDQGEWHGRELYNLKMKGLISERENRYRLHDIIRSIIPRKYQFSRREFRSVSEKIGTYFEETAGTTIELLEASTHYLDAGSHEKAALIIMRSYDRLLNEGYGQLLIPVLSRFEESDLSSRITGKLTHKLYYSFGDIYLFLDMYEEAKRFFDQALESAEQDSEKARVYQSIGNTYKSRGEYIEANPWYEKAYNFIDERSDPVFAASVLLDSAWCDIMGSYEYERGETLCRKAIELVEDTGEKSVLQKAYFYLATLNRSLGRWVRAHEMSEQALQYSLENADQLMTAKIYLLMYTVNQCLGKWDLATEYATHAYEIGNKVGAKRIIAASIGNIGGIQLIKGNLDEAENSLTQSIKIFEEIKEQRTFSEMSYNLVHCYKEQGKIRKALKLIAKVIKIARRQKNTFLLVRTFHLYGMLLRIKGNWDEALAMYEKARKLGKEMKDPQISMVATGSSSVIQFFRGNYRVASTLAQKALTLSREIEDRRYLGEMTRMMGWINARKGNVEKAKHYLTEAMKTADGIGDRNGIIEAKLIHIEISLSAGDVYAAEKKAQSLLASLEEIPLQRTKSELYYLLSKIELQKGCFEKAYEFIDTSLKTIGREGRVFETAYRRFQLAAIHEATGNKKKALKELKELKPIFEKLKAIPWIEKTERILQD